MNYLEVLYLAITYLSNQKEIKEDIFNIISDSKLIIIKGSNGTGKTFIIKRIAEEWKNKDELNSFLFLSGDKTFCETREYFPFDRWFSENLKLVENHRGLKHNLLLKASKMAPFNSGDLVEHVIESISNYKENQLQEKNQYMLEKELEIVYKLQYVIGDKNFIICIDDLLWWDTKSIEFLKLLLKRRNSSLDFLKNVVFIFCLNEVITEREKELVQLFNDLGARDYTLNRINRNDFEFCLYSMGLNKSLNMEIIDVLFTVTGGNLSLIKQNVIYINDNEFSTLQDNNSWLHVGHLEFLIEERLKSYGDDGVLVNEILKYASILGLSFSFAELEQSTKKNKYEIKHIIKKANQMSFVDLEQKKATFVHEIIQALFKGKTEENKSEYYRGCAESIKILKPGEYLLRHNLYLQAALMEEAALNYLLEYLRMLRKREHLTIEFRNKLTFFSDLIRKNDYINVMSEAYRAYYEKDYQSCIKMLTSILFISNKALQAEKDYLLSLCLNKQIHMKKRLDAVSTLETYLEIANTDYESEIWSRLMSILMVSYIHINEREKAKNIEKLLIFELDRRSDYDIDALDKIHIYYRKSGVCHETDTAMSLTQKSVEYFGPSDSSGIPRHPIEYYMALSNHIGNTILGGEFEKGYTYALELLRFINKFQSTTTFPRLEVALNNYIVNSFLAGKIVASKALDLMVKFVFIRIPNHTDNILIRMNYAIFVAMNGEIELSQKYLIDLLNYLKKNSNIENYYYYCIYSNLMVVQFQLGNKDEAESIYNKIEEFIPNIGDPIFYRKRHVLLGKLFKQNTLATGDKWLDVLNIETQLIEQDSRWNFYGKGYLFSDVQFWSES
jgi:hypothetical protein